MGKNIKLARKPRKLTTVQVFERAGIARSTLYLIEKGDASVSLGAYFNVLRVLGLQNDFLKLLLMKSLEENCRIWNYLNKHLLL